MTNIQKQTTENEASRRRRAISMSLSGFLNQSQLLEALWLWEREYAKGSAFEISDYLHAVCKSQDLKSHQSEIRRNLIRYMAQPLNVLGPDPWPMMRDYAMVVRGGQQDPESGNLETPLMGLMESRPSLGIMLYVINRVLDSMLNANPAYAARTRKELAMALGSGQLGRAGSALSEWLLYQKQLPDANLPVEEMRRIVNMLYVLACEFIGPNLADTMLHEAVDAASALPAAKRFSPSELL